MTDVGRTNKPSRIRDLSVEVAAVERLSMHLLSILLLVIGGLIALHSWGLFGRPFSCPLLGGLMLMVGLRLLPATSSWWWLGAVADPVWLIHLTLIIPLGILGMAHEWWSSRSFNRVHQFLGIMDGESDKHVSISLYKNKRWHIAYRFHPPPLVGDGWPVSGGLVGIWRQVGADFVLEGYGESWSITIYECDGVWLTDESCILGENPWDSFDGIALRRVS